MNFLGKNLKQKIKQDKNQIISCYEWIYFKRNCRKMNASHPDAPTTAQNITNKLARETIKFSEVVEIAELLGYSVEFIPYNRNQKCTFLPVKNGRID